MHDNLIFAAALIGMLGIGAQWLAWRIQAPAIVLMSAAGLIVGPIWHVIFGAPLLAPSVVFATGDTNSLGQTITLLGPIISLAVAVILFEGGLNLRFHELRESGEAVMRLVFVATPIAWGLGTLVCHYVAGLSWGTAALFAGILVVTGPHRHHAVAASIETGWQGWLYAQMGRYCERPGWCLAGRFCF